MSETEGVIKYRLEFSLGTPPESEPTLDALDAARTELHERGLVGQVPHRYDGYGFGNVSARSPSGGFWISGTQTGAPVVLGAAGYAIVTYCDPAQNHVIASGAVKPSSESLTHGAVYALSANIQCVLHAHSPDIWRARTELALPTTRADVPYGTPAMAAEVARLYQLGALKRTGVFAMAGHEDGVVSFGNSIGEAKDRLVRMLDRARQLPEHVAL